MFAFFTSLECLAFLSYVTLGALMGISGLLAALRYFTFGSLATIFAFKGLSVTHLVHPVGLDVLPSLGTAGQITFTGLIGLVCALILKSGGFPFHSWVADVYGASNLRLLSFFAVIVKLAVALMTAQIVSQSIPLGYDFFQGSLLAVICFGSLTTGSAGGVVTSDVHRMYGFSSVHHVGFLVMALRGLLGLGLLIFFFYLATYLVAGLLLLQTLSGQRTRGVATPATHLARSPLSIISLTLALLSLAGVPPLIGFYGKVHTWFALLHHDAAGVLPHPETLWTVGLSVFTTFLAALYYFRLGKIATMDKHLPVLSPQVQLSLWIVVPTLIFLLLAPANLKAGCPCGGHTSMLDHVFHGGDETAFAFLPFFKKVREGASPFIARVQQAVDRWWTQLRLDLHYG